MRNPEWLEILKDVAIRTEWAVIFMARKIQPFWNHSAGVKTYNIETLIKKKKTVSILDWIENALS